MMSIKSYSEAIVRSFFGLTRPRMATGRDGLLRIPDGYFLGTLIPALIGNGFTHLVLGGTGPIAMPTYGSLSDVAVELFTHDCCTLKSSFICCDFNFIKHDCNQATHMCSESPFSWFVWSVDVHFTRMGLPFVSCLGFRLPD